MIVNRRDSIIWDHEPPHYLIIVPPGYSDVEAQALVAYYGEVRGHNVDLKRVGAPLYGARYTNLVLVDVIPDTKNRWWDDVQRRFGKGVAVR